MKLPERAGTLHIDAGFFRISDATGKTVEKSGECKSGGRSEDGRPPAGSRET